VSLVSAPYLGKQEGKDLGKVGTKWPRSVSSQIRKQLDSVVSPKSKLTRSIMKPKTTWVEPKFYAHVEDREITSGGLAGASSFNGLSPR
jgi:bifunctional non-homologous end joining protein LigD